LHAVIGLNLCYAIIKVLRFLDELLLILQYAIKLTWDGPREPADATNGADYEP